MENLSEEIDEWFSELSSTGRSGLFILVRKKDIENLKERLNKILEEKEKEGSGKEEPSPNI